MSGNGVPPAQSIELEMLDSRSNAIDRCQRGGSRPQAVVADLKGNIEKLSKEKAGNAYQIAEPLRQFPDKLEYICMHCLPLTPALMLPFTLPIALVIFNLNISVLNEQPHH